MGIKIKRKKKKNAGVATKPPALDELAAANSVKDLKKWIKAYVRSKG